MNKYNSYLNTDIDWIGQIPDSWKLMTIRRLTKDHKQGYYSPDGYGEEGHKLVRITDLDANGNIDTTTSPFVNPTEKELEIFEIKKGDILFPRTGSVGLVGVAKNDMKAVFASYLIRFRFSEKTDNSFMRYFFISEAFLNGLFSDLHGGVNQNIHAENIKDQWIALPSLSEQISISNFLDHKTAKIDDLIAKKQRLIQLLEEERTAIINQAVTKGLNLNVPMKDSGIDWLGEVPEHWGIMRLRNIVETIKTGSTPPSEESQYYEPQEIDWYGPGDFDNLFLSDSKRKISRLAIQENKCRLFPPNSILLIGIGATVGKVAISNKACSSNQQINAIILKDGFNPIFNLYFLSTLKEIIVMEASSATLPIFNQTQTKNLLISVPPIQEQDEIANFIENEINRFNHIVSKTQQEIELLKEYKTALISEVVTGKVDVRDYSKN